MSAPDLIPNLIAVFQEVLQALEDNSIEYMIVGSVASIVYGEPRLTKDMDLVIELAPADARKIPRIFPAEKFYSPPVEILGDEIMNRGHFNLIHHDSGLKIDLMIRKNSEHAKTEFTRRRKIEIWEGFFAPVAAPEDVIIKKLVYYTEGGSEKHVRDIQGILSNSDVDRAYIEIWTAKLGLADAWGKCK
ncbi:MAG: hypothetical protein HYW49_08000 [Deltaproteobacteria bacterium]|nr:hypothetical protein [Deltaproteobacteria bacterium]